MPSRLSSLLVRDGVVGIKLLERAFQRQVIYGGALDTNLLEMRAATEPQLLQYASLATGIPPATQADLEKLDPAVVERCPEPLAREHQVVPMTEEPDALLALVFDPVDVSRLEALAAALACAIEPRLVLEYRFHEARGQIFGADVDSRFSVLAARLAREGAQGAAGAGAESVVIDSPALRADASGPRRRGPGRSEQLAGSAQPGRGAPRRAATQPWPAPPGENEDSRGQEVEHGEPEPPAEPAVAAPAEAPTGPPRAATSPAGAEGAEALAPPRAAETMGGLPASPPGEKTAATLDAEGPEVEAPGARAEALGSSDLQSAAPEDGAEKNGASDGVEARGAPESTGGFGVPTNAPAALAQGGPEEDRAGGGAPPPQERSPLAAAAADASTSVTASVAANAEDAIAPPAQGDSPLTPEEARAGLAAAHHRDEVFFYLLRAVRSQTPYAALLTVQGGAAIGRVAIADGAFPTDSVREALIPLDVASPFKQAVDSGAPYIGPVAKGDADVDPMVENLGGSVPRSALILPVSLRGRVVALAFGHRGREPIDISEVSAILPVAGAAADALHRLLTNRKAGRADGAGDGGDGAVPRAGDEGAPTAKLQIPPEAREQARSEAGANGPRPSAASPVEALLSAVARGDDEGASDAKQRALQDREGTRAALAERFPGPLELDRHNLGSQLRPAPDHGPLLELVVELGEFAAPLVTEELRSDEPAHRYYAALCAGAIQPPSALAPLVDCLFDADAGVRAAATEALASYPQNARDGALGSLREVLAEIDEARVAAAAQACAALAHAPAIPALIEALGHGSAPDEVRRALVALAKQDFGASTRRWRSWWNKNRDRSRIEWMIEGLGHRDAEVRRSAIEELRRLTGEYFGYHHDLPKRERNEARQRWETWWRETGRARAEELVQRRQSSVLLPASPRG